MANQLFAATILLDGRTSKLILPAPNLEQAKIVAARSGRLLNITKVRAPLFARRLSLADRSILLQRIASMVASKVGLSDSLRIIRDSFTGSVQDTASRLLQAFENGSSKSLPDAMEAVGTAYFPETTVALVRTGAQAGDIAHALREAVRFEIEMTSVRKESRRGLTSALFGFVLGVVTLFGSTLFVGPKMMELELFQIAKASVNIDWVMTMSSYLNWSVGIVVALLLGSVILLSFVRPFFPSFVDRIVLRIPYYRDLVLARQSYMTFFGLGILLETGVRLEECMRLTRDTAPKGELRDDLERARKAIIGGQKWPSVMRILHPTDRAALAMAEDQSQIARTVSELAQQYKELYRHRLSVMVPIIQVLAATFLCLAAVVLFGVSTLPLFQVSGGLLNQF